MNDPLPPFRQDCACCVQLDTGDLITEHCRPCREARLAALRATHEPLPAGRKRLMVTAVSASAWAVFVDPEGGHIVATAGIAWALFEGGSSLELLVPSDNGRATSAQTDPRFVASIAQTDYTPTALDACQAAEALHQDRIEHLRSRAAKSFTEQNSGPAKVLTLLPDMGKRTES